MEICRAMPYDDVVNVLGDMMGMKHWLAICAAVVVGATASPARAQTVEDTITLLNGYTGNIDRSEQPFDRVFTYRTSDAPISGAGFPMLEYAMTVVTTTLEGSETQERTITFDVRDIDAGTVRADNDQPRVDFTCDTDCFLKAHTTVASDPADTDANGAFRNSRNTFFVQDEERGQRFVRAVEYLKTLAAPTDPFATENVGSDGVPVVTPPALAVASQVAVPDVPVPAPEPVTPPPPPPCFKYLSASCESKPYLNGFCQQAEGEDASTTWFLSAPVLADAIDDPELSMRFHVEVLLQFGAVLPGAPSACFEAVEDANADIGVVAEQIEQDGGQVMRIYLD
ncbi:MAG: hypothetical protein AAF216_09725, partial [Pseudomonadota bacterium]